MWRKLFCTIGVYEKNRQNGGKITDKVAEVVFDEYPLRFPRLLHLRPSRKMVLAAPNRGAQGTGKVRFA
jgi:hypothetical protein